jgi:copper resistance protein C
MRIPRHLAATMAALSLTLAPAAVLAHTELTLSDPADGAVLTEAPTEVVLTFSGEIGEDGTFTVTDADGASVGEGGVDLDVADRNILRGDVTITEPGEYTVTYAVAAEDGHPTEGELTFTFDPEGEASTPDTAVPVRGTPAPAIAGLVLVLASGALAVRRIVIGRA